MTVHKDYGNATGVNITGHDHMYHEDRKNGGSFETDYKYDWDYIQSFSIKPVLTISCESRCATFCQVIKGKEEECKKKCYDNFCSEADIDIETSSFSNVFVTIGFFGLLGVGGIMVYNKLHQAKKKKRISASFDENLVGYTRL